MCRIGRPVGLDQARIRHRAWSDASGALMRRSIASSRYIGGSPSAGSQHLDVHFLSLLRPRPGHHGFDDDVLDGPASTRRSRRIHSMDGTAGGCYDIVTTRKI